MELKLGSSKEKLEEKGRKNQKFVPGFVLGQTNKGWDDRMKQCAVYCCYYFIISFEVHFRTATWIVNLIILL